VVQTLERGKQAANPGLVVMAHDTPVLKLEDAPHAELVFKVIVPRDIPRVAVEIQVADVEESSGPKHAVALCQQPHLIIAYRNTRENREEDDNVDCACWFTQGKTSYLSEFEMWILSACPGDHSRRSIDSQEIVIARPMKLG
jgi:hypothetical protein